MWSSLIELIHSVFEWARDPKFQRSESSRKRSIKSCNRLTCFSGTVRRRLTPFSKCKYRAILLTLASDTTIHYLRRRYVDTWVRNSRDRVPATNFVAKKINNWEVVFGLSIVVRISAFYSAILIFWYKQAHELQNRQCDCTNDFGQVKSVETGQTCGDRC